MLSCPSDIVVMMRPDSDQTSKKFELLSRFDRSPFWVSRLYEERRLYVKTISVQNRVGAAI